MSSLEKKKRKKTKKKPSPVILPTSESTKIPSLPDDLLISCLSRLSRLYYPTLSLVSKSFRSLVASPELYEARSSLGRTEKCLYVCLQSHPDACSRWFTLCLKPDQIVNNDICKKKKKKRKKSCGYVLAEIPHSRLAYSSCLVTIGSSIYNVGGPVLNQPCSIVSVLNCVSNTWHEAPSMRVKRMFTAANVVDGKIYVAGGCKKFDFYNWMEVFDSKTQAWELVPSPVVEIPGFGVVKKSVVIDGKVYMLGKVGSGNGLAYEPTEGKWEKEGWEMDKGLGRQSYCVVENVLYSYWYGEFNWYDSKVRVWRYLKGVKGLPKFPLDCAKLADYGGKMAVLWENTLASSGYKDKLISCAVIELERRGDDEIWGKVEWHDAVLTVPKSCTLECALAVTV